MYILDDSILAQAIVGKPAVVSRLKRLEMNEWAIPAHVASSLIYDMNKNPGIFGEYRDLIENLLNNAMILPLDFATLKLAAEWRSQYKIKKSHEHQLNIQALVSTLDAVLATRSASLYPREPAIQVDVW